MSRPVGCRECYRSAAAYIVTGDLRVEFPTELELIINLRSAKHLGLTVPATLLTACSNDLLRCHVR
jgi:hypothetical protein